MSLKVWLPLTKDLSNQGLSNVTVTNGGATLDNNGKLGKCYNFDGTDDKITISNLPNPANISVAFWMKRNATTNTRQFMFTAWGGVTCEMTTSNYIHCYTNSGGGACDSTTTVTADTGWVHVVYTFQDKVGGKLYLNGSLVASTASTSSISWTTTTGNIGLYSNMYYNGKINDFRFYDHVLSAKEVKELSKGLVAHYPLNGNGRGGDNLITNSGDLTKWTKESGITTTWDSDKGMYKISDSTHTSSRWGIYRDIDIEASTKYTLSCTFEGQNCGVGFGFYDSTPSGFPNAVMLTTDGEKVKKSYVATSGANSTKARIYLFLYPASDSDAWFSLPKLEIGKIATPWMPNSTDSEYTSMDFNSTIECDVSGHGYNGTKNGTFAYDVDTPRYLVSTNLKSTSTYIKISNLTTTGFANSYSFAWWGNVNSYSGPMMWGFSNGIRLNGIYNGNLWNTGDGSNNPLYTPGTTTQVSAPTANEWHHFVMTGDGTTCKVYKDGELWATAKTYKAISGTEIIINGWDTGTTYKYSNYYMSDFRIYATALSADDVKELYNSSASISNNGAFLTYGEFIEI